MVVGALGTVPKDMGKGLEELEIRGRIETIQTIVEIRTNTEKSLGDLSRFAVTQTPEKGDQLKE